MAAGRNDRTVAVWEAGTGRLLRVLAGQHQQIMDVAFTPDGSLVAAVSAEFKAAAGRLMYWDVATGQVVPGYTEDTQFAEHLTFSPDGTLAGATGSRGPLAGLWAVPPTGDRAAAVVCGGVARGLTRDEWAEHAGDAPYEPACPWP